MRGEAAQRPPVTLREHVDRYLDVHAATRDPNTIRVLRERLRGVVSKYGDRQLRELERMSRELAEWQATLPERSRYGIMQALRQCLEAGVRWGDLDRNPAKLVGANPPPPPRGVRTFTLDELDKLATELGTRYGPMTDSPRRPGSDRRSGLRSSARTSTGRAAPFASFARTSRE
jgi:hypothetical protein